jgi:Xaa-Pro aminopeptidase
MSALPTLDWDWAVDLAPTPDGERMRRDRGERVRAMMADSGIDALILLGEANVTYAAGATSPTRTGGRANVEGPVAVVLLDDPMPHLFTPFLADAAVELGLDDDHLHGAAYLDLAEGVEAFARRIAVLVPHTDTIGVDEVTGAMRFFDDAIVDAGPALRAVRRIKTDDEVAAIRCAVEVADTAMAAAVARLRPGVTEGELTSNVIEATWTGDLVALHAAVVAGGYLGEVGRTWPAGEVRDRVALQDAYARSDELWARLLAACQPGAPASALLDAYREAGEPLPVMPIGRGLGLGFDDPVIARHLPETAAIERLDPGVVLVVTACVFDDVVGSVISREAVRITADGPEVLSSSPSWSRERVGAHT